MAAITVRNVADEVHRALRVRAALHGRSTEAEIRAILEAAVKPEQRLRMGDALAAIGRRFDLQDEDLTPKPGALPAAPMDFPQDFE